MSAARIDDRSTPAKPLTKQEVPPFKPSFCRFCCRMYRWVRTDKPKQWRTVCCQRVYFKEEQ